MTFVKEIFKLASFSRFNPLMLTVAKSSLTILMIFCRQKQIQKIFDEDMSIRTLPTTLLQIFCKISFNSKVIVKSIIDPDEILG